ncbi:hypothetical protein KPH14_010830 [Odynerus spinipes]|uniref:Uncharacterized protein n=1 Tax=Odynerus spinipes TaxID=1348599 RepID=A0AAD9VMU6_9HYME|nr:hypothetical protein KPH14_010830 [Odynerus spinipes]
MSFHEFNPFTGRLKESTHFQPFYPLKPSALQKSEPPAMIWDTINTKPVAVKSQTAGFASSVDPKILEKFKHFQKDIHKPVYLMGGTKDKILFGITLALFSVCAYKTAEFYYIASKKF